MSGLCECVFVVEATDVANVPCQLGWRCLVVGFGVGFWVGVVLCTTQQLARRYMRRTNSATATVATITITSDAAAAVANATFAHHNTLRQRNAHTHRRYTSMKGSYDVYMIFLLLLLCDGEEEDCAHEGLAECAICEVH